MYLFNSILILFLVTFHCIKCIFSFESEPMCQDRHTEREGKLIQKRFIGHTLETNRRVNIGYQLMNDRMIIMKGFLLQMLVGVPQGHTRENHREVRLRILTSDQEISEMSLYSSR